MEKKLNLSDFNTESENVLQSDDVSKKNKQSNKKRIIKKNKLEEKLQISVTQEEYNNLYAEFEESGFTSFAGYIRMKLKEIKFI